MRKLPLTLATSVAQGKADMPNAANSSANQ
jgi:hypothetical protein